MTIVDDTETTDTDQDALLRAKINRQFDRVRARLGCESDAELARCFNVRYQYISYWRNLKTNKLDKALARLLLDDAPPLPDELPLDPS